MERAIAAAAAYVPLGSRGGEGRMARDEDGFTLAATALERIDDARPAPGPPTRLLLVGDLPTTADVDLVRFLGFPVFTKRFGTGLTGLTAALASASDPVHGSEPVLILAVDLPSVGPAPESNVLGPRPDAAVALRVEERVAPEETPGIDDSPGGDWSATLPLLQLGRKRAAAEPDVWVGDFVAGLRPARPVEAPSPDRPSIPSDGPVSQGAYIPLPRYVENLSSRWRFTAEKCGSCAAVTFPPHGRCRQCGATDGLQSMRLPRDGGVVVASTTIGPGGQPTEFDEQVAAVGPYGVVLVELAPGARVTVQVADARPGEAAIGSRVATRLRRLYPMEGEWRYGRKAIPLP